MRRKDGKPKKKARKTLPVYSSGFFDHPLTLSRRPTRNKTTPASLHTIVSLFSGCGGLDLGFMGGFQFLNTSYKQLPFHVVQAVDNSEDAVKTYNLNLGAHAHLQDLTLLPATDLAPADILMGGFPCQDFSSSGGKTGFSGKRGRLYRVLVDYMREHQPKVVVAENVPHLARLSQGHYLKTILKEFEAEGYKFDVWNLYAPDYGLPQSRRRLFLIGIRNDLEGFAVRPRASHTSNYISIDKSLADLEAITDETVTNQSQYFVASKATAGGGQGDHTNQVGKVAYCIRANARGRIQFHYHLPRRLTVRECARLQSFPDEFVFPFSTQRNMTLIGNAVPPILGHHVAVSIATYLTALTDVALQPEAVAQQRVLPSQASIFDS